MLRARHDPVLGDRDDELPHGQRRSTRRASSTTAPGPNTGKLMHPGGRPEGSELTWPRARGGLPSSYGRHIAFADDPAPDWTWEDFAFTEKSYRDLQPMAKIYNSDNDKRPDLGAFTRLRRQDHRLARARRRLRRREEFDARLVRAVAPRGGRHARRSRSRGCSRCPGLYHGGGYINYSLSLLPKLIDLGRGRQPLRRS